MRPSPFCASTSLIFCFRWMKSSGTQHLRSHAHKSQVSVTRASERVLQSAAERGLQRTAPEAPRPRAYGGLRAAAPRGGGGATLRGSSGGHVCDWRGVQAEAGHEDDGDEYADVRAAAHRWGVGRRRRRRRARWRRRWRRRRVPGPDTRRWQRRRRREWRRRRWRQQRRSVRWARRRGVDADDHLR